MQNVKVTQIEGVNANELITQIENVVKKLLPNSEPQPEEKNDLMTRTEVAKYLDISLVTLHTWTKKGILTSYRIGNKVRYKKSEVLNSLKATNKTQRNDNE